MPKPNPMARKETQQRFHRILGILDVGLLDGLVGDNARVIQVVHGGKEALNVRYEDREVFRITITPLGVEG